MKDNLTPKKIELECLVEGKKIVYGIRNIRESQTPDGNKYLGGEFYINEGFFKTRIYLMPFDNVTDLRVGILSPSFRKSKFSGKELYEMFKPLCEILDYEEEGK